MRAASRNGTYSHSLGVINQYLVHPHDDVFIQMRYGHVFVGFLQSIGSNPIPNWVTSPLQRSDSLVNVYIQNSDGLRLTGILEILHDIYNPRIEHYSCYIPIETGVVLSAFLNPINEQRNVPGKTSIYVRMPDNDRTYIGVLELTDGVAPDWLRNHLDIIEHRF